MNFYIATTLGLLLCLYLRELSIAKERLTLFRKLTYAQDELSRSHQDVRSLGCDVLIMRSVLVQRHLVTEQELVAAKIQLINQKKNRRPPENPQTPQTHTSQMFSPYGSRRGDMH